MSMTLHFTVEVTLS